MTFRLVLVAAAAALCAVYSMLSKADPLIDIAGVKRCSSAAGGPGAAGHCRLLSTPKGLHVDLKAGSLRQSFSLPAGTTFAGKSTRSIGIEGLVGYNDSFVPEVWQLNAGDLLQVALTDELPSGEFAATNLHTHGLLVSPGFRLRADGTVAEPVGDSVFVCTIPAGDPNPQVSSAPCLMHHAAFGSDKSTMSYSIALPRDHPEGLFWYHPHVHENSRLQVADGMSGLIFVRGLPNGHSGGTSAPPGVQATERFLILKDLQIGDVQVAPGGDLTGSPLAMEDHDSQLCPDAAAGSLVVGGVCFDAQNRHAWLFTVNGQVEPDVAIPAGGKEIWRIANASADTTYDLALVQRETGRPLRVQLLARDGVSIVPEKGSGTVMTERVLMMPGSRVELGIDRATAEGLVDPSLPLNAVLRTYGYYTGGDAWPAANLMTATFSAQPSLQTASAPNAHLMMKARRVPSPTAQFQPFIVRPWQPAAQTARAAARAVSADAAAPSSSSGGMRMAVVPAGPSPGGVSCNPLPSNEDRVIALAIDKTAGSEKFKMGIGHTKLVAGKVPDAMVTKLVGQSKQFDGSTQICARAGTTETWTIVNKDMVDNHEMHSFHVHQMKFKVLNVIDPAGRIQTPALGAQRVDSYPVPINGALRIQVTFTDEQVGRFVFHCHILEHEDKGMMGVIEVKPRQHT